MGKAPGYYINVGLFAQESNARTAQAKLLNEGLPVFRQTTGSNDARRTRVRVGPFATDAEAQTAVKKIKSLGLDALVYKKNASQ